MEEPSTTRSAAVAIAPTPYDRDSRKTNNEQQSEQCTLFVLCSQYVLQQFWWVAGFKSAVAAFDFSNLYASVILTHLPLALGSQTMASKTDEFRSNADECRRRAEGATKSFDKEHWLRMAEHWSKMAAAEEAAAAHS
jgi:hypothetical protein